VRAAAAAVASAVFLALAASAAFADEGDRSTPAAAALFIGQQTTLDIQLLTPPGAIVEVDALSPSWQGAEVIRLVSHTTVPDGAGERHTIRLVVAPFFPGEQEVIPAFFVETDGVIEERAGAPFRWTVASSLPAGAPLEISPIAPPRPIGGAESPLLRPALAAAGVGVVVLVLLAVWGVARWVAKRPRTVQPPPVDLTPRPPVLQPAEQLIDIDPAAAYRHVAAAVRSAIGVRYGVPANAMTSGEIRGRMEAEGIDRWEARLVAGLLEQCDAVVYAGYRPAAERRQADLVTAREIIGETV
jgi:hypothetical protein